MFYVLLTGKGQGCDYCIDCNKTFRKLKATSKEEANREVSKIVEEYDFTIAKAVILDVINVEKIDVDSCEKNFLEEKEKEEKAETLKKEQAQYKKLKEKFEGI